MKGYGGILHYVQYSFDSGSISKSNEPHHIYINVPLSPKAVNHLLEKNDFLQSVLLEDSHDFYQHFALVLRPTDSSVYSVDLCLKKRSKDSFKNSFSIPLTVFLDKTSWSFEVLPAPVVPSCSSLTSGSGQLYPWIPTKKDAPEETLETLILELFKPIAGQTGLQAMQKTPDTIEIENTNTGYHSGGDPFNGGPGRMPKRLMTINVAPLWMIRQIAAVPADSSEEELTVEYLSDNGDVAYYTLTEEWLRQFPLEDILQFDFWRQLPISTVRGLSTRPISQSELCHQQQLNNPSYYDAEVVPYQAPDNPKTSTGIVPASSESTQSTDTQLSGDTPSGSNNPENRAGQGQHVPEADNSKDEEKTLNPELTTSENPVSILIHQTHRFSSYLSLPLPAASLVQTNGDYLTAEMNLPTARLEIFNLQKSGDSQARVLTKERSETGYYYRVQEGRHQTGMLPPNGALLLSNPGTQDIQGKKVTHLQVSIRSTHDTVPALFLLTADEEWLINSEYTRYKLNPEGLYRTEEGQVSSYKVQLTPEPIQLQVDGGYFITGATEVIDQSGKHHSLTDFREGKPSPGDFAILYDGSVIELNYPFGQKTEPPAVKVIPEYSLDLLTNFQEVTTENYFNWAKQQFNAKENTPRLLLIEHGGLMSGSIQLAEEAIQQNTIETYKNIIRPRIKYENADMQLLKQAVVEITRHLSFAGVSMDQAQALLSHPDDSELGKLISGWSYIAFHQLFSDELLTPDDLCRVFDDKVDFYLSGEFTFYDFFHRPSIGVARFTATPSVFSPQGAATSAACEEPSQHFISTEIMGLMAASFFIRMPIVETRKYFEKMLTNPQKYTFFRQSFNALVNLEPMPLDSLAKAETMLEKVDALAEKYCKAEVGDQPQNNKALDLKDKSEYESGFILDGNVNRFQLLENQLRDSFYITSYLSKMLQTVCIQQRPIKENLSPGHIIQYLGNWEGSASIPCCRPWKAYDHRFSLYGIVCEKVTKTEPEGSTPPKLVISTGIAEKLIVEEPERQRLVTLPPLRSQQLGHRCIGIGEGIFKLWEQYPVANAIQQESTRESSACFKNHHEPIPDT